MIGNLRNSGRKTALSALCAALLFVSGQAAAATTDTYKITVAATVPKGFAGATPLSTQPSSTKFTPCSTAQLDGVTFTVTYDAGKTVKKDVYLILHNPEVDPALGTNQDQFFTITKFPLGNNQVLTPYSDVTKLNDSNAAANPKTGARFEGIYVKAAENPGTGAISEPVFGGAIILDGVTSGTWQMVGIIADSGDPLLDFNIPSTWAAWDVATIVLGKPWASTDPIKSVCKDIID